MVLRQLLPGVSMGTADISGVDLWLCTAYGQDALPWAGVPVCRERQDFGKLLNESLAVMVKLLSGGHTL